MLCCRMDHILWMAELLIQNHAIHALCKSPNGEVVTRRFFLADSHRTSPKLICGCFSADMEKLWKLSSCTTRRRRSLEVLDFCHLRMRSPWKG
ncbi:unnamed protein product [Leptidea sinapis]|uniref:Uncharacterized protein n=1 Tax=Leptidea sinapis TaxID=189913 RepID=A0A5E4QCZ4_9NEOP|nr:unnamed protein product [Leptidea sinapis]